MSSEISTEDPVEVEGKQETLSAEPMYAVYEALKDLCTNNVNYFRDHESVTSQRLHGAFLALSDHVDAVKPLIDKVRTAASSYNFDDEVPGNGYLSFVNVVDLAIRHSVKWCREVCVNRDSYFFRASFYMREIEAISQLLASLVAILQHLLTLMSWGAPGELFPESDRTPEELIEMSEAINQYCFYGRCLGFQYCESVQTILKAVSIAMASYSDVYYGDESFISRATNTVWNGGKYFMDPELRARRVVRISKFAEVDFCKSFWFLTESEVMQRLPKMVSPALSVNRVIAIPPELLQHEKPDGTLVDIPIPSAHTGVSPLMVRLMSAVRREGMVGEASYKADMRPPSPGLIVHCHGGGFVAQSSSSHEPYLRDWARQLGVPILSVDYSLAPEAPFPRALEEMLYAYCWALKNCHLLGSTAQRVVLVGDSAGANLNVGMAMKCIELGIRIPTGIFIAYAPIVVDFAPSPSRLLCLMDPLLPFGFLLRCLKAYACPVDPADAAKEEEAADALEEPEKATEAAAEEPAVAAAEPAAEPEVQPEVQQGSIMEPVEMSESELAALAKAREQTETAERDANGSPSPSSDVRYMLDCEKNADGEYTPVLRTCPTKVSKEKSNYKIGQPVEAYTLQERMNQAADTLANTVTSSLSLLISSKYSSTSSEEPPPAEPEKPSGPSWLHSPVGPSPIDDFKVKVPRNPYLSPCWASDDVLKQLPPTSVLSAEFDPCLDDCVMFAKKLRKAGNKVTLDVVKGLPHGFLNFCMLSKEAHEASKVCVKRIMTLLKMENVESSPESESV